MDPKRPEVTGKLDQERSRSGGIPVQWGDRVWDPHVQKLLDAIQGELNATVRGGPIFERVAESWKRGSKLGSNIALGEELGWSPQDVAEGFRLIREHLRRRHDSPLRLDVPAYTRELRVMREDSIPPDGSVLLSIPLQRAEELGQLVAGLNRSGIFAIRPALCGDAEEEARTITDRSFAAHVIWPVGEADDFDAFAKLSERTVLLDVGVRGSGLRVVGFDYRKAGYEAAMALLDCGCSDVLVLTSENDGRAQELAQGYRQAMRERGREQHRACGVDTPGAGPVSRPVVERLCWLQANGYCPGPNEPRKVGLLCAESWVGDALLGYLDTVEPHSWRLAVGTVGGGTWPARHWADIVALELDYGKLGVAAGALLQEQEGERRVAARVVSKPGRRPPGSESRERGAAKAS